MRLLGPYSQTSGYPSLTCGVQGPFGGLGAWPGAPSTQVTRYRGVEHSVSKMKELLLGTRGAQSPTVRFAVESIVREVAPKDYLSECLAIRYWVNEKIPYMNDPVHVEWMRDPQALLEAIAKDGKVRADCDEVTLLTTALWCAVGRKCEFVTVSFNTDGPPTHVFSRCGIPKTDIFIVCDPVAGTREARMLSTIKAHDFIDLS